MRIQNNIPAYNAHRNYGLANSAISSSAEKLSSGYRINRAGDDAAGLAISEKMRAQIRGLEMASKNTADAVSLIQTAEGALQKTHDILQRMRELAVQSASDTNETIIDRGALDAEFQQLKAEVDDIARVTRFNDQNLIDGTFQANKSYLSNSTAYTSISGLGTKLSITVDGAKTGVYGVAYAAITAKVETLVAGSISTASITGATVSGVFAGVTFSGTFTDENNNNRYTLSLDAGSTMERASISLLDTNGEKVATVTNLNLNNWASATNGLATYQLNFADVGVIGIGISTAAAGKVSNISEFESFINGLGLSFSASAGKDAIVTEAEVAAIKLTINGESSTVIKGDTYANFVETGITINFFEALTDYDVTSTGFQSFVQTANASIGVANETRAPLVIQSGANQGDETRLNIDAMTARFLGIAHSDIATQKSASNAITEVNNALNKVSTQRAGLGALQNRLTYKQENLDISAENLTAAESRIRDVDMAKEMTNFSKKNIVSQAATAMLAQANTLPQNVLQLLR